MTVIAQVGDTFESLLVDAPVGLVGQMGWRLIDPSSGQTMIPHRTDRITEPSDGTYFTADTAPLQADQYLMIWDYQGEEASEALIVQATPSIGPRYATVMDLRAYSSLVDGYDDNALNNILREAEHWIDWYVPPAPLLDTGLKFAPLSMAADDAIQLNYATCAQAEYILHMGPGFFISGSTRISGGDYQESGAPKVAPKSKSYLINGGFVRMTARAV